MDSFRRCPENHQIMAAQIRTHPRFGQLDHPIVVHIAPFLTEAIPVRRADVEYLQRVWRALHSVSGDTRYETLFKLSAQPREAGRVTNF